MEIKALEAEAKAKATKYVANMLHAPDKLEKVRPRQRTRLNQVFVTFVLFSGVDRPGQV